MSITKVRNGLCDVLSITCLLTTVISFMYWSGVSISHLVDAAGHDEVISKAAIPFTMLVEFIAGLTLIVSGGKREELALKVLDVLCIGNRLRKE